MTAAMRDRFTNPSAAGLLTRRAETRARSQSGAIIARRVRRPAAQRSDLRNRSRVARLGGCLVAAALALAALAARASADEASPALAKYQEQLDTSLDRALAFLAKEQQSDGCWAREGGSRVQRNVTGITSLALMAFLAKGHTPGVGPYGDCLNKGIDFILASQQPNGMLVRGDSGHGPMYSHNISTLMLSEVSGMVDPPRQAKIDVVLGKALKAILSAQQMQKDERNAGGWRYQIDSRDSDISCTSWAIMALRSARNNGAVVPKDAIEKGLEYIMNCRDRGGSGGFAYQPGGAPAGDARAPPSSALSSAAATATATPSWRASGSWSTCRAAWARASISPTPSTTAPRGRSSSATSTGSPLPHRCMISCSVPRRKTAAGPLPAAATAKADGITPRPWRSWR